MKICYFEHDGRSRLGVVDGDRVNDLSVSIGDLASDPLAFLDALDESVPRAREATESSPAWIALDEVALLCPVGRPRKFLAIALNYHDHLVETGREAPGFPTFFTKQSTCVIGAGAAIVVPRVSHEVDYEGELAVVIGRRCRAVPAQDAMQVVAGYTIVNDVSVRDWQRRAQTMMIGKSFDTHGPMGPWLVTSDEVGDPHDLRIRTWLNGELMQDGRTGDMIFDIGVQIETLSTAMTLEPGDVISTGTPAGVGVVRSPQVFLTAGDVVRIEIDRIGTLENPVAAEDG